MFKFSLMVSLTPSYLLLITFQSMHFIGQGYSRIWFGPGRRYPCYCSKESTCGTRGECSGTCASKFFGPSCQYVDIFAWEAIPPTEPYLLDGLYTTCNPDAHATKVEIFLANVKTFSWYRIIVKDTRKIGTKVTFETIFNGNQRCVNERVFIKDMTTVDVTCEMYIIIQKITIDGNVAPLVCSIHIGEGRNLAFKEMTNQSSTYSDSQCSYDSSKAVDDDSIPCRNKPTCSHTLGGRNDEWWLTLSSPAIVYYVKLMDFDGTEGLLRGNIMRLITEDLVTSFTYTFKEVSSIMTIRMNSTTVIKYVSMKQTTNEPLLLCKVLVFGDAICPDKKFGFMCDGNCSCLDTEYCNMITGTCGPICGRGWYGANCTSRCSNNCLYSACDYSSGNCLPCVPGYNGNRCDEECSPGTYGAACKLNCSIGCSDTCKSTNGTCACKNIFMGSRCQECRPGNFGPLCKFKCSEGCKNTCNNITGHCVCTKNYVGSTCTECRPGNFGPLCESRCSVGCKNSCNTINGHCVCTKNYVGSTCTECRPGYFGPLCKSKCSKGCKNTCNNITGHCVCTKNYVGSTCTECRHGNFGPLCKFKCSVGCKNTCNNITGHCVCTTDFIGLSCTERLCPEGYNCSDRCLCMEHEICEVITGKCTGDCVVGYFGKNCTEECSEECNHKGCDQRNGRCHQCNPGYTGDYCNAGCDGGTFGLNCGNNCSKYCADVCNSVTGSCTCKDGYVGSQCAACRYGMYGDNCSLLCPEYCYKNMCNADTGECISCLGHRIGSKCEDCSDTYYGPICEYKCSEMCVNETCDNVTGKCLACPESYTGFLCSEYKESQYSLSERSKSWNRLLPISLFLLICVAITTMFCVKQRDIENIT